MPNSTISASELFDREFLAFRSRLIDVAAALDRLRRAPGEVSGDARSEKIRQALQILIDEAPDKTEQIQMLFSLPYEKNWRK
jgi:hypothetical protein